MAGDGVWDGGPSLLVPPSRVEAMPCKEDQDVPQSDVPNAEGVEDVAVVLGLSQGLPLLEDLSLFPLETGREGCLLGIGDTALEDNAVQVDESYWAIAGTEVGWSLKLVSSSAEAKRRLRGRSVVDVLVEVGLGFIAARAAVRARWVGNGSFRWMILTPDASLSTIQDIITSAS